MSNAFEMSVVETLMENNLELVEVAGNGNCFFSSIVHCLKSSGKKATICGLRQKFSAHLAARVDELAPFFSAEGDTEEDQREEYEEAVKMIRKDRFWDNQIIDLVVGCATEVLCANVTIFDIDQEGNVTEYEHVYEPDPKSADPEDKVWPVIKLLRQDDNHFNALIPVAGE